MNKGEDLTTQGIEKIVSFRAFMNLGLTSTLKEDFPNLTPGLRPVIKDQ